MFKTIDRNILFFILLLTCIYTAHTLPVKLGHVEIGLESYDGYQEGMAYISTDQQGNLEIMIGYKGFGLDEVIWLLGNDAMMTFKDSVDKATWWRSRLLEMDVNQVVARNIGNIHPKLTYKHRDASFDFEDNENILQFVRQGKDYALLLMESSKGTDTRRSGNKTLPVFTVHFASKDLPILRDMIAEKNITHVLEQYQKQSNAIEDILSSSPNSQ